MCTYQAETTKPACVEMLVSLAYASGMVMLPMPAGLKNFL